jgi:hypothetical protein
MKLLDVLLAFSITLAALATVVTVLMEAILRTIRMRKRNLLEALQLLNKELDPEICRLGLSPEERWQFISDVVTNPARGFGKKLSEKLAEINTPEDGLRYLGIRDPAQSWKTDSHRRILTRIKQCLCIGPLKGYYDKVSLEHIVRKLTNLKSVKEASLKAGEKTKTEIERLARKYEEIGSAVSARFKRRSQAYSIGVGILLALLANLDGLRILEAYRSDAELAAAVIAQQERFVADHDEAVQRQNDYEDAKKKYENLKNNPNAKPVEIEAALKELDTYHSLEQIREITEQARQQIANLTETGVPIGWQYYPACPFGSDNDEWLTSDRYCQAIKHDTRQQCVFESCEGPFKRAFTGLIYDTWGFIRWSITAAFTGLLIGLGAPFWFDVAKRLTQLRQGLQKATASSENRMSGANADGKPEKRRQIVERAVNDTIADEIGRPPIPADQSGKVARDAADTAMKPPSTK